MMVDIPGTKTTVPFAVRNSSLARMHSELRNGVLTSVMIAASMMMVCAFTSPLLAQQSRELNRQVSIGLDHHLNPAGVVSPGSALTSGFASSSGFAAVSHSAAILPDTVRVLAVMVEFQEDDDNRSSGTGKFGSIYSYDYGTEILDPLPHDRAYFQQHLRFLENYVRKSSAKKTFLTTEVLDGIVTVSGRIQDYSFREGESEKPVADLAVEAWSLADTQFAGTDFSSYHMFVILHAGRGRDIDLVSIQGYNPTPYDIPSLAFTLSAFRKYLGFDYQGIPMQGGSFHITNSSIVPTTDNREISLIDGSLGLLELTINGLLAASFGTYAGLPDLFNTETGKTGIGRFGLMDGEGIFAYGGICPPEPSAWEKQSLGWTVPKNAAPGKHNYMLTASDTNSTPDILRVGITGKEYWLVENRQRDVNGNGQTVTIVSGGREQQLHFPKDTTGFENGNVSALRGVVVDVEDIDWSIPGGTVISDEAEAKVNGGILIWHIDEVVIDRFLRENAVNANDIGNGVDLEQAQGPQDIGVEVETVFGPIIGGGSPLDYWLRGNISPIYTNSFNATSMPNSRANNGSFTHVTMDGFTDPGLIMSMDVALGDNTIAPVPGFPIDLSEALEYEFPFTNVQTADLDGDGEHELLVTVTHWRFIHDLIQFPVGDQSPMDSYLFIYRQDGSPYVQQSAQPGVAAIFERLWCIAGPPSIGDIDGDGTAEIVVAAADSGKTVINIFSSRDDDGDGRLDLERQFTYAHDGPVTLASVQMPIIQNRLLYAVYGSEMDSIIVVGSEIRSFPMTRKGGNPQFYEYPGVMFSEIRPGKVLLSTPGGPRVFGLADGKEEAVDLYTSRMSSDVYGASVSADIDGDGVLEGYASGLDRTGSIVSLEDDEKKAEGLSPNSNSNWDGNTAVADADGDGRLDLLRTGSGDRLTVLNYALASVDEYPLPWVKTRFPDGIPAIALSVRPAGSSGDQIFVAADGKLDQLMTGAKTAAGFPIPLPGYASVAVFPSPTNQLAIAAAGSDRQLYLYYTPNQVDENSFIWRSLYADERNSNTVTLDRSSGAPITDFFPLERCYNWPNPVYTSDMVTKIRFYVSEDANITINIYDLAGEKVDELHARGIGGTDNDVDWDIRGIQSDVYLAHVEAVAGAMSASKIIKVAVIK